MPNDGFLNNDDEADELLKFWEEAGHPSVPPEFEDVSIEEVADRAIAALRINLTTVENILLQTQALYATIKFAGERSKPVTMADRVTAEACLAAAADTTTHQTLAELLPIIADLRSRAYADDLTVLKLAKITAEILKLQPRIENVVRWHANLKHAVSRGMAQLN